MANVRDNAHWEKRYVDNDPKVLPWYIPHLDGDLGKELNKRNIKSGTFLDLGTGPGTQAIQLNARGFKVTGADVSPTAISKIRQLKAAKDIDLIVDDIINTKIEKNFDYILDRGTFHVFEPELRPKYLENIIKLCRPGTILFLKCFSDKDPEGPGPFRISPDEIKRTFESEFVIESISDTEFTSGYKPVHKALFCVLIKKELKLEKDQRKHMF